MSLLRQAPRFTLDAASVIARTHYGLDSTASPLPSERDQNFRISSVDAGEFVLKIANRSESSALLQAQNAAMTHLASTGLAPQPVADLHGNDIAVVRDEQSVDHFVRLVTWIPGVPLGTVASRSPSLFEQFGRAVAAIDQALASFDHPAVHRDFYWDLAKAPQLIREHHAKVPAPDLRVLVQDIAVRFARDTARLLPAVRTSTIHNDLNDYNVIVQNGQIAGVIDFGDMVHGWTVGELAIAIAYAVLDQPNPAAIAHAVLRGYEAVTPLTDDERAALFPLVRLRLAMSVCIAARQTGERPGDDYLAVSQEPIRRTLPALMELA